MIKQISRIAKIISFVVAISSMLGIGYFVKKTIDEKNFLTKIEELKEVRHYILHSKTKRIHIDICDSEDRMSDKNKIEVEDSIYNLTLNGYVVCGNCNAGIKGKNPFFDIIKLKNMDIKYYEVGELPKVDEYLKAINDMGEWYSTHVSTYRTKFQTEPLSVEYKNGANIKEYNIDYKKYNVVTKENTDKINFVNDGNMIIQRASEDAIDFYINNKWKIVYRPFAFYKKTAYYPCELLDNIKDDYDKAGDDCVRFFFSLMNSIKPDFTYHLKWLSKKEWSKITTFNLFSDDNDMFDAMHKLGFEIYDKRNIGRDIDIDGKIDYNVKKIDNNFVLKKGDIMLRDNHLHVYMGDGYNLADNYGWGRVYGDYPRIYNFLKNNNGDSYYYLIKEENDTNLRYTRIYRYVGK